MPGPGLKQHLRAAVAYVLRWVPLAVLAGGMAGSASALLLISLAWATAQRERHPGLIAFLPLAGLGVGLLYRSFGTAVERGNNLILDEIHVEAESPGRTLPLRMTPLILLSTFITHLFGGSAGREGTAVQAGAALADRLARHFHLGPRDRRVLLMAGMSAGFASVFGTPLAGAVFGMEVLTVGAFPPPTSRTRGLRLYPGMPRTIMPCALAAFAGDMTTRAWHVTHTVYRVTSVPSPTAPRLLWAVLAGCVFGLAAMLFARASHAAGGIFQRAFAWSPLRPMAGGALIATAVFGLHTTRFIGLGIPEIVAAFAQPLPPWEWAWKLAFTVVTLGAGFKGGEVTPLFFIGATLGNALACVLPLPFTLLGGMGFAAVFAGAANTPVAAILMAVELFGPGPAVYVAVACLFAYLCSGPRGIYHGQRPGTVWPRHRTHLGMG